MSAEYSALSLGFTLAALMVALVTVWLGVRFLIRLGKHRAPGQSIRLRASVAVGSRTRLLAVSYRGREYLLGVASESVSVIDTFPEDGDEAAAPPPDETGLPARADR